MKNGGADGNLIGLGIFLVVILLLALANNVRADDYYTCQFLGYCPDSTQKVYIPAVECGRRC